MAAVEDTKKDEIIVNFQSCTGIEDIAQAVLLLEEAGWDIELALKNILPEDENEVPRSEICDSGLKNGLPPPSAAVVNIPEFPSTSNGSHNDPITVYIHVKNTLLKLTLPESTRLGQLKDTIFGETELLPNQQILSGWTKEPEHDRISLGELGSAPVVHLILIKKPDRIEIDSSDDSYVSDQQPEASSNPYGDDEFCSFGRKLKIRDEMNGREYILLLTLDTTVSTVKSYTKYITDIPVINQVWTGWPPNTIDIANLYRLSLDTPYHSLKVRSNNETPNLPASTMCIDLTGDTDSSPEDFEDASESFNAEDEIYIDDAAAPRTEPLIPDNVEDETAGSVHFIDGFALRYGQTSPNFLPGSLEEAIKESCMKPAKERRMLAIYLHHDASVLSNVFCTELLCSETVLQTFGNYFLLWGWDLTNDANKNMFLASAMKNLGSTVADTVRNMNTEQLPALLIVTRSRSNTELFNVIYGNIGLNDFFATLIHAVDFYSELQESEIKEEEERAARQQIKTEQDHAFQQSLLMDRAKDEAKKQKLMLETQEELRKKKEKEAEEKKRLEEQTAVMAKLPAEPEATATDIIKIKFRAPTGDTFERRFGKNEKLEIVFDYLLVEGYRVKEYKVITSWPRKDISGLPFNTTLKELNLHIQETLIIEER